MLLPPNNPSKVNLNHAYLVLEQDASGPGLYDWRVVESQPTLFSVRDAIDRLESLGEKKVYSYRETLAYTNHMCIQRV
jgi:hypothetical protein